MTTRNAHNPALSTDLMAAIDRARLHDEARVRAVALRAEAIGSAWDMIGRALHRLHAVRTASRALTPGAPAPHAG